MKNLFLIFCLLIYALPSYSMNQHYKQELIADCKRGMVTTIGIYLLNEAASSFKCWGSPDSKECLIDGSNTSQYAAITTMLTLQAFVALKYLAIRMHARH